MAGAMRKMAVYLGLVEDDRYERYDTYHDDEDYEDYDDPRRAAVDRSVPGAHADARAGAHDPDEDTEGQVPAPRPAITSFSRSSTGRPRVSK